MKGDTHTNTHTQSDSQTIWLFFLIVAYHRLVNIRIILQVSGNRTGALRTYFQMKKSSIKLSLHAKPQSLLQSYFTKFFCKLIERIQKVETQWLACPNNRFFVCGQQYKDLCLRLCQAALHIFPTTERKLLVQIHCIPAKWLAGSQTRAGLSGAYGCMGGTVVHVCNIYKNLKENNLGKIFSNLIFFRC